MQIYEITDRNEQMIQALYEVWKASVEATHTFLSPAEIERIGRTVPEALKKVSHLLTVLNEEHQPIALIGVNGQDLDLLFIAPAYRRKGIGKQILTYVIDRYQVHALCVNEQNPQAKAFYEHMGFHVIRRSECDEQGNPYPLLYMELKD